MYKRHVDQFGQQENVGKNANMNKKFHGLLLFKHTAFKQFLTK